MLLLPLHLSPLYMLPSLPRQPLLLLLSHSRLCTSRCSKAELEAVVKKLGGVTSANHLDRGPHATTHILACERGAVEGEQAGSRLPGAVPGMAE